MTLLKATCVRVISASCRTSYFPALHLLQFGNTLVLKKMRKENLRIIMNSVMALAVLLMIIIAIIIDIV